MNNLHNAIKDVIKQFIDSYEMFCLYILAISFNFVMLETRNIAIYYFVFSKQCDYKLHWIIRP